MKGRGKELEAESMRLNSVKAELEVKGKILDESDKGMFHKFTCQYNCLTFCDRTERQNASGRSEEHTRAARLNEGYSSTTD